MGVSSPTLQRAYSTLELKSIDDAEQRVIVGIASSPEVDRGGDIMEPDGAQFSLPMPFLWQHDHKSPIGEVFAANVTKAGIEIKARIAKVTEPGVLKDRLDEAWQSIRERLVKGLSIGWRPLEAEPIRGSFGFHVRAWEWVETSAVTIPMNVATSITAIKSADAPFIAALGESGSSRSTKAGATAAIFSGVVKAISRQDRTMRTIQEQIKDFQATRQAKNARLEEIQNKASGEGRTKDDAERQEFDTLKAEIKQIDGELVDLNEMEALNKAAAVPVNGETQEKATASRNGGSSYITIKSNLPPGIEFSRAVMCKIASFVEFSRGNFVSAADLAKQHYPDFPRIHQYLKGAVPAATTTQTVWAAPLVDPTNLSSEFIEYLRPQTILGRIQNLRMIPFNVRIIEQTGGGNGYWVAQGAPKPLTAFSFQAITHTYHKVAAISAITEELARFSSPNADGLVRDSLKDAIIARMDISLVDPTFAAVSGTNPASITYGVTPLSSAGTSADNARTDVQNLLEQFLLNNLDVSGLVLIMPNTLALALSVLVNSLGQREFPDIRLDGGSLMGIPVVTSQYVANQSGAGNMVIALNARELFVSDDGQVTVDASREASLQMLDNPTNNASTATATTMVSMWQTNSIALRAERYITWTKRRSTAVSFMDDVNWGSIGSPS